MILPLVIYRKESQFGILELNWTTLHALAELIGNERCSCSLSLHQIQGVSSPTGRMWQVSSIEHWRFLHEAECAHQDKAGSFASLI